MGMYFKTRMDLLIIHEHDWMKNMRNKIKNT